MDGQRECAYAGMKLRAGKAIAPAGCVVWCDALWVFLPGRCSHLSRRLSNFSTHSCSITTNYLLCFSCSFLSVYSFWGLVGLVGWSRDIALNAQNSLIHIM